MTSNSVEAYYRHGPDQPVIVTAPEDMNELIDHLLTEPFKNSIASLYHRGRPTNRFGLPDHQFYVAVNAQDNTGGLYYMGEHEGEDGSWYSKGQTSSRKEVFYYHMGNDREFPRDSEITLDMVREAAREFLEHGERPTCIDWQPWRQDVNG